VVGSRAIVDLGNRNWITYEYLTGGTVGVSEILAQIDREIAQLQQARSLLGGAAAPAPKKAAAARAAKKPVKKKRNLTPEGRKRIAEAVKRRWAEQKKAAAK
jgi:pyruvate/2-oxoglutarate dehydrogenase complex dihydrolipoamide acyltransferase (E2) component